MIDALIRFSMRSRGIIVLGLSTPFPTSPMFR
jgi:hypothetical protein